MGAVSRGGLSRPGRRTSVSPFPPCRRHSGSEFRAADGPGSRPAGRQRTHRPSRPPCGSHPSGPGRRAEPRPPCGTRPPGAGRRAQPRPRRAATGFGPPNEPRPPLGAGTTAGRPAIRPNQPRRVASGSATPTRRPGCRQRPRRRSRSPACPRLATPTPDRQLTGCPGHHGRHTGRPRSEPPPCRSLDPRSARRSAPASGAGARRRGHRRNPPGRRADARPTQGYGLAHQGPQGH